MKPTSSNHSERDVRELPEWKLRAAFDLLAEVQHTSAGNLDRYYMINILNELVRVLDEQ